MIRGVTSLFPLWAVLVAGVAYSVPEPFVVAQGAIVPLLGLVMLSMGMTLTWASFAEVFQRPRPLVVGAAAQFLMMPLFGWLAAWALSLPPQLAAGLVLVGACPGGTASNLVTYLARGDVALSISLTSLSTLLAVVATPLLTWVYVGQQVPVPVGEMLGSIFKILLLPVALGVAINQWLGARLGRLRHALPLLSVAAILVIIGMVVALNRTHFPALGPAVALAVVLHNGLGLLGGYWAGRLLGWDERICRTLAIEVGMQNSGLGVALAMQYFSAAAALPGALFSVWHNLSGSLLAGWWSRRAGLRHHPLS